MKAKALKEVLDQEHQMLKLTLDVLAKENEKLKQQATELENNVKKNKLQLQDYLNSITNKDSAVESLNKKIEQLHIRLNELNKSKGHVSTNGNEKTSRKIKNEYKYSINKEHFYNFCQMQYQLMNEIDRIKLLINNCIIEKKNLEKNILICDNERINMNKLFDEESIAKINNVFDKETDNKTIYLIDKEKRTWKFSKREDLSIDDIINKSSLINSTPNVKIENFKEIEDNKIDSKEIEDNKLDIGINNELYTKVIKYSKVSDMLKDSFIL